MLRHKAEYDKSNAEKEVDLTFTFGSRNQVFLTPYVLFLTSSILFF